MEVVFWASIFLIFYTYLGYYLFLNIAYFIVTIKDNEIDVYQSFDDDYPKVSFIISAYNEESVIERKIRNTLQLKYPRDKLEIIVASDGSTDKTNEIVKKYFDTGIILHISNERKGKTNVQNEAVKKATGAILVFSDANAIWERNSLIRLVSNFSDSRIGYVAGRLEYNNRHSNITSYSENLYWKYDLLLRAFESKIFSITAGNGAIYAVRREDYEFVDPMYTHDLEFPHLMVEKGKRAIYDEKAVAYEKAGETLQDEIKRKVRMFSRNWQRMLTNFNMFNPFKVGILYSVFMVSHKLLRYYLPFLHIFLLVSNIMLAGEPFYRSLLYLHTSFYLLALIGYTTNTHNKLFYIPLYYLTFQYATLMGLIKYLSGGNKAYWDKAESTR